MKAIIVLGCRIIKNPFLNKWVPNNVLKTRLDKCYDEFLNEYDDHTIVIVCGGNPHNEEVTESEVMKEYLIKKGITSCRIFEENKSINTIENCINAYELLGTLQKLTFQQLHPNKYDYDGPKGYIPNFKEITVITSDFHLCRSKDIFETYNMHNLVLNFVSAQSPADIDPSYLEREENFCPL